MNILCNFINTISSVATSFRKCCNKIIDQDTEICKFYNIKHYHQDNLEQDPLPAATPSHPDTSQKPFDPISQ